MAPILDKRRMRIAFSRQAAVYERYSHLQRDIGDRLLAVIAGRDGLRPKMVLDIGCGTGYLLGKAGDLFPDARLTGVDISPGMLAQCRKGGSNPCSLVQADAESLPFCAGRFDLVLSTSTYQWVEPLRDAFGETGRVVRSGGVFAAAVFGRGTLRELRDCYTTAFRERYPGVAADLHPFPAREAILNALKAAGFGIEEHFGAEYSLAFSNLEALFRYLKGLGAQSAVRTETGGLGKRRLLARTDELYRERFGAGNGLPAAFTVEYFLARKGGRA